MNTDPKIIAAIITASVALLVGIWNIILTIRRDKLQKNTVSNQNEMLKELENLKLSNQKILIGYEEKIKTEKKNKGRNKKIINESLFHIQAIKDSIYFLANCLKQYDENQVQIGIKDLKDNAKSFVVYYDKNYMELNKSEKIMMHELKNMIHTLVAKLQIQSISDKLSKKENIEENLDYLDRTKKNIEIFQNWTLEIYKQNPND